MINSFAVLVLNVRVILLEPNASFHLATHVSSLPATCFLQHSED